MLFIPLLKCYYPFGYIPSTLDELIVCTLKLYVSATYEWCFYSPFWLLLFYGYMTFGFVVLYVHALYMPSICPWYMPCKPWIVTTCFEQALYVTTRKQAQILFYFLTMAEANILWYEIYMKWIVTMLTKMLASKLTGGWKTSPNVYGNVSQISQTYYHTQMLTSFTEKLRGSGGICDFWSISQNSNPYIS